MNELVKNGMTYKVSSLMQKILHKNTYYSTNKNNALKLLMFGFIVEVSQNNSTLRSLSQRQYI